MSRVTACVVVILLASVIGSAQVPGSPAPGQPPRFPGAAGTPRDNPSTAKAGTAILRGRVVAAETGQPLRKAQVRLSSNVLNGSDPVIITGLGSGRATSTDANGRYEFKDLAAGRYTVSASKGSYLNLSYGQRRPNEPGKPLELLDGQTIEKVDFSLPRGAIVTGRILDEIGEPAESIQVALMQLRTIQGRSQLVNMGGRTATSNDLGEFRIVAVPPGQYYLSASTRSFSPVAVQTDDRSGYAPTYYPGTPSLAEAQRVTLAVGQTLSDLTMTLVAARLAHIAGVALDSQGRPMASGNITLTQRAGNGPSFTIGMGGLIKPDGSFQLSGLAPGEYVVSVSSSLSPAGVGGSGAVPELATARITLAGQDVDGVQLVTARLSTLSGRIIASDAAQTQALRPATIRLAANAKEPDAIFIPGNGLARVNDDGTFSLASRPGSIRIALITDLSNAVAGWTLKAVRLNGVDVTDAGFDVTNEDIGGLEVEVTNRVSSLSGVVTNGRGEAVTDYSAIVFSQDRERWNDNGRYFRSGRPDQDGRFKVTGLPAGEYFAIALDSVDPTESTSPEFLERASSRAVRFTLGDGETRSVDLKLTTGF
jgi:hypothetical protein